MHEITLITLVICVIGIVESYGRRSGPYDSKLVTMEACEDQGSRKVFFDFKMISRRKGKYVLRGNSTLEVPADNKLKSVIEIMRWGNGGWQRRYAQHAFKNCETIFGFLREPILGLLKAANSSVDKCPIPADTYVVNDWEINFNPVKKFPVMEYGRYRPVARWYYGDEFVGCHTAVFDLIPKDSSQL